MEKLNVLSMVNGQLVNLFSGTQTECYDFVCDSENSVKGYVVTTCEPIQPNNWYDSQAWAVASSKIETYKNTIKELEKLLKCGVIEKFDGKVCNVRFDNAIKEHGINIRLTLQLGTHESLFGTMYSKTRKGFSYGMPRVLFTGSTNEQLEYKYNYTPHSCDISRSSFQTDKGWKYTPMVNDENRIISVNVIKNVGGAIQNLKTKIKEEQRNKNETKNQKQFAKLKKMQDDIRKLYSELPYTFKDVNYIKL